ncbi:hypothetical protein KEJ39_07200 [Candidatus Bathyarchaeota archaeon]|nr:hypothetical protein [Candidatus Bathyarchaeota archaeon]
MRSSSLTVGVDVGVGVEVSVAVGVGAGVGVGVDVISVDEGEYDGRYIMATLTIVLSHDIWYTRK